MTKHLWRTVAIPCPGLELGEVFIEAPLLLALCSRGENYLSAAQADALAAEQLLDDGQPTERLYDLMHTVTGLTFQPDRVASNPDTLPETSSI